MSLTPDAANAICRHMNDDHGDAVAAYARTFGAVPAARAAAMLRMDASAMELQVESDDGSVLRRIAFDHELADATDARETLIAMARQAMGET